MKYFTVNSTGREDLIAYLRDWLKEPENAERHADALIDGFDGSDTESTPTVEIRGFYTTTGNPIVYTFGRGDLNIEEVED
jgi:hypothetical protein